MVLGVALIREYITLNKTLNEKTNIIPDVTLDVILNITLNVTLDAKLRTTNPLDIPDQTGHIKLRISPKLLQ